MITGPPYKSFCVPEICVSRRKAVRVCNNLKIPMIMVPGLPHKIYQVGSQVISTFVSTQLHSTVFMAAAKSRTLHYLAFDE